jgi:hypothetical protein
MAEVDRRHVLATLAAGLITTGQAFAAASPSQEIARRLAQAQQDGKVYGLHTLVVSQGRVGMWRGGGRPGMSVPAPFRLAVP